MFDKDSEINVEATLSNESLQFIKKSGFWETIGWLIDIFWLLTVVSALPILLVINLLFFLGEMTLIGKFSFIFFIIGTVAFLIYMMWNVNSEIQLMKFDDVNSKEFRNELDLFLKDGSVVRKERWDVNNDHGNLIRLRKSNWLEDSEVVFVFKNDLVLGCLFTYSAATYIAPFREKKNRYKLIEFVEVIKNRILEKKCSGQIN